MAPFTNPFTGDFGHVYTRYLDYWYWDYSTTEPYAGVYGDTGHQVLQYGIPMVSGTNVGSQLARWTTGYFKTAPSTVGAGKIVVGYDLTVVVAVTAVPDSSGDTGFYASGFFLGTGMPAFQVLATSVSNIFNINVYVPNIGTQLSIPSTIQQLHTLKAEVRATGTEVFYDGVSVGVQGIFTTADVTSYMNALVNYSNSPARSNSVFFGGHEFKIIYND